VPDTHSKTSADSLFPSSKGKKKKNFVLPPLSGNDGTASWKEETHLWIGRLSACHFWNDLGSVWWILFGELRGLRGTPGWIWVTSRTPSRPSKEPQPIRYIDGELKYKLFPRD
jgi:hypothetical protein